MLLIMQANGDLNMNADLTIHGGLIRIQGSSTTSSWASGGPASLVMTGGTLDFASSGISILPTSHALTVDISGGLIQTVGSFNCTRAGFLPTGGVVEMYSTRFSSVTVHPGSRLNDLIVNKINRGAGPEQDQSDQDRTTNNSIVTLTGNTIINGSFMFTSGEFWLQNYTFTVNGEAEINGKLYMNNSGSKLSVMNSLIWHSSNSVLSAGNNELQNGLVIESGSVFQMGAGMNISFVGVSSAPDDIIDIGPGANYAQVFIGAPNTRFGNLIINKVDNSYGISDLTIMGNNVLTVLGNMTIDGETWLTLDEISMIVNGNLTKNAALDLRNSSSLEIQGNVVNSDGALGIFENSLMDCQGSFDHPLGTEMEIDSYGCLRLSRPYAGIYQSFAGHIAIYETGSLEILNNGLQIGTDNILLQGGTIKVGWSFRAMNPNTFTGGNGRIEMIGARFSDLQMHSSNRFNDLVINPTLPL